jgi:curved DNA-binding protein CbpA
MTISRNLLEALLSLHKNSRSGVLRIERKLEKKQLVLNKGSLVFAESNQHEEHLVHIMVKLNLLPRTAVNEIAALMKTGKTSEEAILSKSNSSPQDAEKGRFEQAILILASVLAWAECNLHFYPGEDLIRCQTNLNLSLPELLLLSVRRAVSDHKISTPPNFMQGYYCIAEDFSEQARVFPLDSLESYVYSMLREPMNTAEILSLIPASETKPEQLLLRLSFLGLIALKETKEKASDVVAATESDDMVRTLEDMAIRFETAGLYEILSIPADATPDAIQTAYYSLAKQFHPDRFQSKEFSTEIRNKAQQVFTRINETYITLKDPVSRALYDEKRLSKESKVESELKARAAVQTEEDKTAEALYRDGRLLLSKGEFKKAIERLNGCVFLRPSKALYNHYLGIAESEIPKLRKSAEQHLLKAIELDKMSSISHLALAKLYIKVNLRRKAELQLQELMRWDPENKDAHQLMVEMKNP